MDRHGDQKRPESGSNIFRRLICRQISVILSPIKRSEYVRDPSSILSLQPWIFKRENSQINEENMDPNGDFSDKYAYEMNGFTDASMAEASPRSVSLGYSSGRGQSSLRSRRSRRNTTKPLTSMENSLIPQLYNENFEIEEYVYSSFSSPRAVAARPFIVTDGSKIISKSGYEPSVVPFNFGLRKDNEVDSLRVKVPLFGFSPLPELRKMKRKSREREQVLDSSSSHRLSKHSHSQGTAPRSLWKPESKIEAELQAELERLELNMNANSLERRSSDLEEVDQELIGDVIHGELRADKLFKQTDITSGGDKDRDSKASSTGGVHDTNYSVCPKELSLRLHEVIQHRLEERIKELEESLSQSLKQLQLIEAEKVLSDRTFSNSDMGSSSNWESPTLIRRDSDSIQPFCLNLAGDALDAYKEAYNEFMRMADSEGNLPTDSANIRDEYGNELSHADRSLIWGLEEGRKDSVIMPPWEEVLKSRELNDTRESDGDEEEEYEDDESKLLIQQIVERARDGSPVLLHAQRILFSADE
uniref:Uncharacterized protein n=1 Tax=Ananas comosus var. bracteatus TaxID=296719 RepID=A0A6V7NMB8_ANACO|nr:unnamed protein product [Ananas comosus var. bracteatus]